MLITIVVKALQTIKLNCWTQYEDLVCALVQICLPQRRMEMYFCYKYKSNDKLLYKKNYFERSKNIKQLLEKNRKINSLNFKVLYLDTFF